DDLNFERFTFSHVRQCCRDPSPRCAPSSPMKGDCMSATRSSTPTVLLRLSLCLLVLVLLVPTIAQAQATIKVNDNVSLRFGTLLQGWLDTTQDPATKSHAN